MRFPTGQVGAEARGPPFEFADGVQSLIERAKVKVEIFTNGVA